MLAACTLGGVTQRGIPAAGAVVENDVPANNGARSALGRTGGGFGLRGIAERVALLGGEVEAGAVPGGWRVSATVPVPEVAPAGAHGSEDTRAR